MLRGHTFIGGFSQGPSKMIGASKRLRISAYLSASFLLIFGLLAVFPVANSISDTNAAARISETTLSMTSSNIELLFDGAPSETGTFRKNSADLSVLTNNYSGYTLSISASEDDNSYTKLFNDLDTNTLDSIETAISEETFSGENNTSLNGKWGIKPTKLNSSENNNFLPAPTFEGTVIDATNSANATENEYSIELGARINRDNTVGNYTNSYLINAVANPVGYSVTYNKNTEDTVNYLPESESGSLSEASFTISTLKPERNGYSFVAWCDGAASSDGQGGMNCDGDIYNRGDEYEIDQQGANQITLYALWNEGEYACNKSATTISEAVCMQDINKDVKASMVEGEQHQLIDDRDGKTYYVSKLVDGRVWMTQNLDLDLESTPTNVKAFTHENTDLGWTTDGRTTWTPVNSTLPTSNISATGSIMGWNSTYEKHSTPYSLDVGDWYWIGNWIDDGTSTYYGGTTNNYLAGDVGDPAKFKTTPFTGNMERGHVGNYYNWAAAVAENDISKYSVDSYNNPNNAPQSSICPAGWRLPSITTISDYSNPGRNDFYNLILGNSGSQSEQVYTADPYDFVRAGYVYSTYLNSPGYYGYYWTQNNYDSNSAYAFNHYASYVSYGSSQSMYYGYSVRCVARDNGTITFDANGGEGIMSPQEIYGNAIIKENEYTKEGETFIGWNTTSAGDGQAYTDGDTYLYENGSEVTLYAQWGNYTYLDFNGNGADSGTAPAQITVGYNKTITLPDNPYTKNGMAFVGWNTKADGSGSSYSNNGQFKATKTEGESLTLYAQWSTVNEYDVDYHFNEITNTVRYSCYKGGELEPRYSHTDNVGDDGVKIDNYGSYLNTNEVVTIEGASGLHIKLTYAGESDSYDWVSLWAGAHPEYTAQNDYSTGIRLENNTTGKYGGGSGTTVEGDIEGDTVTFAFRSDGGGYGSTGYGYYAVITAISGAKCEETPVSGNYVEPTIANEQFKGWTDTDGSTDVKFKNEKAVTASINLEDTSTATEVYAVMAKPLIVKFDANGGTGEMEDMVILYGEAENITGNLFSKEGEAFARWNTAADGSGTNYTDQQVLSATNIAGGELTLYAIWGKPTIVSFSSNNGVGTMDPITIDYGEYRTLPSNVFTKDSAVFVRWNTDASGSGSSYSNKGTYYASSDLNGANVTLYVVWGYDTVINFLPNGGTGEMASQSINYNTTANLSLNQYTKSNNTFFHWNTNTSDTGTTYENGAEYTATNINGATINLYAIWGTNSTIVFNANGGTGTMDPQVVPYNTPTALSENLFTKANESFAWWNTVDDGSGTSYNDEADYTANNINGATINLYAIWGKPTVITFNGNGADGGTAMSQQVVDFGTTAVINANTYTYTNKRFRGWNTEPDGTGTTYSAGGGLAATKLEGDAITLYAIWSSMNFPTDIPDAGQEGGGGGEPTGVTIARAYEIAYTAKGKGMYEETAEGNGIYEEVDESQGDYYHGYDVRFAMQDMTPEICASVTVMEDTYRALDVRDNTLYWIAKLRDGQCWMTQDLSLKLESTPTDVKPLTHDNTDLGWTNWDPTATWTPTIDTFYDLADMTTSRVLNKSIGYIAKAYSPGESYVMYENNGVSHVYNGLNSCIEAGYTKEECTHRRRGDYYSWPAAVAENDIYGNSFYDTYENVAPNSICPAGWRLLAGPTGFHSLESEYSDLMRLITDSGILNTEYGWQVSTSSSKNFYYGWVISPLRNAPFYLMANGAISEGSNSNNEYVYYQGYNPGEQFDYLESRTVTSYSVVPNFMSFTPNHLNWLMGVRCIAR